VNAPANTILRAGHTDKRKPELRFGIGFKSTPMEGWRRHGVNYQKEINSISQLLD